MYEQIFLPPLYLKLMFLPSKLSVLSHCVTITSFRITEMVFFLNNLTCWSSWAQSFLKPAIGLSASLHAFRMRLFPPLALKFSALYKYIKMDCRRDLSVSQQRILTTNKRLIVPKSLQCTYVCCYCCCSVKAPKWFTAAGSTSSSANNRKGDIPCSE